MGVSYNPKIVTNGLVLCLDAGNTKSYPGTGTTWFDLSGNANHATLSSTTFDQTDSSNITFDASADTASIAHSSSLNFSGIFSIETWIKITSFNTSTIYNIVSKKPSFNNTQKGWSCQYDYRTTGILQYRNNDGTVLNDSTPTSTIDNTSLLNQTTTWVNCVWAISGTSIVYYINGEQKQNNTVGYTNVDTTTTMYIGKTVGSVGDPSALMKLSNIKIYNRQLSISEVRQNFAATRGRYGI